jgi:hypothetical protein
MSTPLFVEWNNVMCFTMDFYEYIWVSRNYQNKNIIVNSNSYKMIQHVIHDSCKIVHHPQIHKLQCSVKLIELVVT